MKGGTGKRRNDDSKVKDHSNGACFIDISNGKLLIDKRRAKHRIYALFRQAVVTHQDARMPELAYLLCILTFQVEQLGATKHGSDYRLVSRPTLGSLLLLEANVLELGSTLTA